MKVLAAAFIMALLFSALACAVLFGIVHAYPGVSGISKPSVPVFTVELVDASYDVPTTYSIDPYAGENVTHTGYHVEKKAIEVAIKNQPFTPYYDKGNLIKLYYGIRVKGHFEKDWTDVEGNIESSDSEYTLWSYVLGEYTNNKVLREITPGGKVDFQVEKRIGYITIVYQTLYPVGSYFTGETSGWSNTQTLIVGESQTPTSPPATTPTPTPTPSQESQQTEQEKIIGAAITAAVIVAFLGLIIYLIKRK